MQPADDVHRPGVEVGSLLVEGAPPAIDVPAVGGYLWIGGVGTALAYWCWFRGLRRMSAGAASLVGLVNPVVGTLLGVGFAGELFGPTQALGMVLVLGSVVVGQRWGSTRVRAAVARPVVRPQSTVTTTGLLPSSAAGS